MSDIRKDFEEFGKNRFYDLTWEPDGYKDKFVQCVWRGYQAGRAHDVDGLIAEIKERSWGAKNYNGDYRAVYMDDVEEIIRKRFGKE